MNICIFAGRLARDPEMSSTQNGKTICRFSIAVDGWKKNEAGEKECHFFEMTAWEKTAQSIGQYVRKGDEIKVQCEAEVQKWIDKQSGDKRSAVRFTVRAFWFGQKAKGNQAPQDPIFDSQKPAQAPKDDFDFPVGDEEVGF